MIWSILLLAVTGFTSAAKLPKSWKACQTDAKMNSCLEHAIAEAILTMKNGMPSVGVIPLEPLHFDTLLVDQSTGPVAVKLNFTNLDIHGLTNMEIKDVQSDLMKGHLKFRHYIKGNIILNSDYEINGKVMILPIQGKGKSEIIYENSYMDIVMNGKVIEKKNDKYFQVESLKTKITPGHVKINFTNLFNGNKELGDNMNKFLNENWEDIVRELEPTTSKALSAGFKEIANRVFQRIPLSQIVKSPQ